MITAIELERVMIPRPPTWTRIKRTIWPKILNSSGREMEESPVTQVADVDMKRASMKSIDLPGFADTGRIRRRDPRRIQPANERRTT
jgi:hypothetical protein